MNKLLLSSLFVLISFNSNALPHPGDDENLSEASMIYAGVVVRALVKDYTGNPVELNYTTAKSKIFMNYPASGVGMSRVQIPYVNNGKHYAQIQINWNQHKIVGVMFQRKLGDKQQPIDGLNGKDMRSFQK
jgi:hypothetical protein